MEFLSAEFDVYQIEVWESAGYGVNHDNVIKERNGSWTECLLVEDLISSITSIRHDFTLFFKNSVPHVSVRVTHSN